jgi:hypothetical protein
MSLTLTGTLIDGEYMDQALYYFWKSERPADEQDRVYVEDIVHYKLYFLILLQICGKETLNFLHKNFEFELKSISPSSSCSSPAHLYTLVLALSFEPTQQYMLPISFEI